MKVKSYLSFILLLSCFRTIAQEPEERKEEKFESKHSLGLTIGHEHTFNGRDENGNRKTLALPFWGLDYNFQFSPKFAIGLHTDIVLETFTVEKNLQDGPDEEVERTKPIGPALMGLYKPTKHWSLGLGIGGEFSKEESYALSRLAIEYGSEIGKGWEVFGGLQYDFRWNAYDTGTIGLGISKEIGWKKKQNK